MTNWTEGITQKAIEAYNAGNFSEFAEYHAFLRQGGNECAGDYKCRELSDAKGLFRLVVWGYDYKGDSDAIEVFSSEHLRRVLWSETDRNVREGCDLLWVCVHAPGAWDRVSERRTITRDAIRKLAQMSTPRIGV